MSCRARHLSIFWKPTNELTFSNIQRPTSNTQRPMKTLAGGGARTHTALRPLDFESSASANSATPARRSLKLRNQKRSSSDSEGRHFHALSCQWKQNHVGCRCVSAVRCDGRGFWIAEAHHRDGKRFDVRAEEKLSLAKALPKERQPCHRAIALRLPTWLPPKCLTGSYTRRFLAHPHHRIISYDNDFTVKWRRGFGRKKRS